MDLQWVAIIPILSLLMLVHELGHFITARRAGIVVQEFGFGLPPRIWGYEYKGVIYSLNWIPFGAFVKMLGEEDPTSEGSFASKSKLTRCIVLAAGSIMNFLLAVVVFALAFMTGWPTPVAVEIAEVAADSPAQTAGLVAGDVVVTVDGQNVSRIEEFQRLVRERTGGQIALQLKRGDQTVQTNMTPRVDPPPGQGAIGVKIAARTQPVAHNPLLSIGYGFQRAVTVIGFTLAAPWMVIQGTMQAEMLRPIGLPGMAQVTSQAVEATRQSGYLYPLLVMTGTFSAGLAVANMLPIPALDGGRLFFIIIEAIRGRRISPERESLVHFVGIVVLIALMILIAVNDIQNPFGTVDFGIR
ncbi:MAG: site-2 protease family protein [Chloroflexi bacterium]|nr:site-2 protease family protein [Chloroflexota bacterium]